MLGVWLQLRGLVLFALVIGGGTVKPYRKGLYHYWHAHISAPRAAVGRERSQIDVYLGKDDALTVDRLRELAIAWRKQQEEWQEQISKAENSRKRRAIRKYLGMSHIAAIKRYGIDALEDELKLDD